MSKTITSAERVAELEAEDMTADKIIKLTQEAGFQIETKAMSISYAVVKHAGRNWDNFFVEDPKETGVHISYSAGYTFSGRNTGCKLSYTCRQEAQAACDKLNEVNPVGDYAVCPVIDTRAGAD